MAYKIKSPLAVVEGGTSKTSFDAYTVICGGTTTTGALQNVSGTGDTFNVLTSQGAGALPEWAELVNETFFELLAADPSSPTVGQVWYNTTTHLFKGAISGGASGSWVVKGSLNTGRQLLAGAGDTDDALAYGGRNVSGSGNVLATTERYNLGTNTWTAKTNLNTARDALSGAGTDAADVVSFGGTTTVRVGTTELYAGAGDTWTAKTSMNTSRGALNGGGAAADALAFGGANSGSTALKNTELYNGTTWTNKANMSFGRSKGAGTGTASADCLQTGGETGSSGGSAYEAQRYDGAGDLWSVIASHNLERSEFAASGPAECAITQCGRNAGAGLYQKTSSQYDGTANTWSSLATTNQGRDYQGSNAGPGSSDLSLICGGTTTGLNGITSCEILGGGGGVTIVTFTVT